VAKARRGGKRHPRARLEGEAGAGGTREHWREDGSPKTRYPSQEDANRTALQRRLEDGADLDPYPCSICGAWHLGNRRR